MTDEYRKKIEITDTGMVIASVFDANGNRKGLEFFTQFISTNNAVERSLKKAHAWADQRIHLCMLYERD